MSALPSRRGSQPKTARSKSSILCCLVVSLPSLSTLPTFPVAIQSFALVRFARAVLSLFLFPIGIAVQNRLDHHTASVSLHVPMPLCCSFRSLSKRDAAEAETRRARIVTILSPSAYDVAGAASDFPESDPPPRYEEATQNARILMVSEEKSAALPQAEQGRLRVRVVDEDDGSDMTSIISIPSTQVTGITMANDGTIVRRDMTGRTDWTDSRPPSYYANTETGSRRSPSPLSDGTGRVLRHPVMCRDWRNWVDGIIESAPEDTARP